METKLFPRIRFWVQFLLRNQISIKTSRLRNKVLTRFAPRTTKSFSLCVLILEGMIWTQLFSLKIRVSNDFSGKTNHILKQTFSYKMRFWNDIFSKFQIVNWEFFVPADSIIQNFSNNHILEKDYCPETQFLSSIFIEKSDFDQKFKSEKKNVLTQFAPGKTT